MVDISAEKFHETILWGGGLGMTETALNTSDVQKFLAEDNHFDLVISEQFFQEALYVLAHKYDSPLVLITTFGNCVRHNIITRNPLQLATVVSEFLNLKEPTSFWSRMRNLYFTVYEYVWWKYWYLEKQEQLVKKYIHNLPQPVPSLYELQGNASLILLNGHFSFDTPTAYLPNVVEVGGVHLSKSDGKLPPDLQKLLDDAVHGVVYVNFGSNVRSSELPTEKKNAFLNVFRRLRQTVIWKWEDDTLQNIPKNLVLRDWLPQKEILSHPNVKVFISHGGLIGTQEAIFYGVPIIGVPIYSDQYNNLLQVEQHGFGRILEYKNIDEMSLQILLDDILNNESYSIKAKEVSKRFKDRPLSAMDTAIFWIEYVIRNKGANFMKNPARDLSWMAYSMLDVYLLILFVVLLSIYAVFKVIKLLTKATLPDSKVHKKKRS
ncbi:UDP-glycosyltransferase UGT5 isoform X2 [Manduca sexta]|nr:UDP-glycosyltransferase UGT5 isoform X2 [Manduca sexta]